ncbi:MAG: hypothetical protein R6V77_08065, partial [Candidatus Cloacimonadaceae bacterium]
FRLEFLAPDDNYYKLKVSGFDDGSIGAYQFNYSGGWPPDAFEPDNSSPYATPLTFLTQNQVQAHTIHLSNDEDWFTFYAVAGRTYTVYSTGNTDVMVYLYDTSLNLLGSNDDGFGYPNFLLQINRNTSGVLYLKVVSYGSLTGHYNFNYSQILSGITPPLFVNIYKSGLTIYLNWSLVLNATSYRVEGSDNPYSGFVPVATVPSNSWSTSASSAKKFYRVIALN